MNKNIYKLLALIMAVVMTVSLSACNTKSADSDADSSEDITLASGEEENAEGTQDEDDELTGTTGFNDEVGNELTVTSSMPEFSDRDFRNTYEDYETITLSGSSAETTASSGVKIDGSTITINQEGIYLLTGTLTDGQIIVDVDSQNDKVQLVLDGASITNTTGAAIYVKSADKVFITTARGSENTVESTGEYIQTDDNNVDGAIFSKDDIVFNGEGVLNINSIGHGIVSKDDIKITDGTINITSASKGIQGKDMVAIAGGTITIDAETDGIKTVDFVIYDGELNINAGDDGISATENEEVDDTPAVRLTGGNVNIESTDDGIQTDGDVTLAGSNINIVSGDGHENAAEHYDDMMFGQMGGWGGMGQGGPMFGGDMNSSGEINYDTDDDETLNDGSKNKGIKAANATMESGSLTIDAQDDAVNVSGDVTIEGGTYEIAAGDDGIHADYHLTINGGTINMTYAWEGLEATIIKLNDGDIYISAQDDGVNAAQKISGETPLVEINGGNITIDMAQGDTDALDSNGNLYINGGTVNLNCQSPFDYEQDGSINGGTVYVNGSQVTEIYNQFMGGGMGAGQGGFGQGAGGMGQGGPGQDGWGGHGGRP